MKTFLFALVAAVAAQKTCTEVSVVGDATYCIQGPICVGSGLVPAGNKCPVKGDVASASCLPYLKSYSNGKCVAPVDGVCEKIPSGAWGCVWPKASSNSTAKPITTATGNLTTSIPLTTRPGNSTNSTNGTKPVDIIVVPSTTSAAPNATTKAP